MPQKLGLWLAAVCVLVGLCASQARAQVVSSKGREFWLGFMENLANPNQLRRIYISSETAATVTVTPSLTGTGTVLNVPANGVVFTDLDPATYSHTGEGTQNLGVRITSTADVSVFALNYAQNISDATVVLPIQNLGTEYYAMTVPPGNTAPVNQRYAQVLVTSTADGSQIEFTPTSSTISGRAAGVPFTVTLNRGQTYQIQSAGDLTGTRVRSLGSCQPFAAFSGNIWIQVCGQIGVFGGPGPDVLPLPLTGGCGQGNHLVEQLLPLKTWGKTYLVIPYARRRSDYIRIQAQEANTSVFRNGVLLGTIGPGAFIPYPNDPSGATLLDQPTLITSDKPIGIAQFSQSQNMNVNGTRVGDPFYIMLSPVEQTLNQVSFAVFGPPTNPANAYVNIVTKTSSTGLLQLTQNGGPFTGPAFTFQPVPASPGYSYARVTLLNTPSAGFNETFSLRSDSGFTAQVYMFGDPSLSAGNFEAYGYSVGVNLSNLTLQANLSVPPPFCTGLPVTFTGRTTIPTDSWTWDFGDGTPPLTGASLDTVVHSYTNGGTYKLKLTVTRSASCATDSVVRFITVNGQDMIRTPDTTVCQGTTFQLRAAPGAVGYTWTPATGLSSTSVQNPFVLNATTSTTYRLQSPFADGCVFLDTVRITVAPPISISRPIADTIVCRNASVTLRSNQVATWRLRRAGVTTTLATGVNQIVLTTPTLGTDTVYAATPFCSAFRRLIVRDRARILSPLPLNQTVCTGTTVSPTSEIATTWLLFTPPSTLTTLATGTTVCPPQLFDRPGSFVILSRNCSVDDSLRLTVTTIPMIYTGDTTVCFGSVFPLLTRAAVQYTWSPAAGLSSTAAAQPTVTATATTNYQLIARTADGCVYRDSVRVTVSPPLSFVIPRADTLLCIGQSAVFRSNIPATWRRRRGAAVTVLATGVAQLTVPFPVIGVDTIEADNIGCRIRRVVTVRGIANIISPATATLNGCTSRRETFISDFPGDWYVRRGASAPVLFAANTTTPPTVNFPSIGIDSVIVRSCGTQRGVRIVVDRSPIITPTRDTTFCVDRSVIVRTDIPALYYRLDVRGFRQIGTGLLTQVDTLTFIEGDNFIIARNIACDDTFRVVGVIEPPLILTPATNQTVCQGERLNFTSREVGIWYRRRNGVETELARVVDRLDNVLFNTPGIDTIRIRNCGSFNDRVITVNPRPFITPNVSALTLCQNAVQAFTSAVPATWTVTGPTPITIAGTTASPAPVRFSVPGIYRFTTNALGCRDTIEVTVNPVPVLTPIAAQTRNVACFGEANGAVGLTLSGALAPYAVLWSNGATTPSITGLVAGDYIVSVTDARSCITRDTFTVTQPAPLTISNVVPINLLCRDIPNGQLALTVVGGTPPYVTNGVLGTTLTGLTFGTVPLTVVDANGCTVTSTSTITAPPLLTLALTAIPENCTEQNGSVTSAVTGGVLPYSYTWSNSRTSPSIGRVSSGSYQLTVVDANACSRVASANVARLDPPSAVIVTNPAPPIILVLPETRVQFVGQTDRGAVFLWEFGDGQTSTAPNPAYTYTDDGEFTVNYTSTDTAGCSNTESFGPIVITKQPTLDVPNVFTPNGDGVNDVYAINLISSFTSDLQAAFVKQFSMRIFDRWGRPVFASSSITSGWAGDVNGAAAPAGVYFFEITITFVNDLSLSRRGSLTLLR